MDNIVKYQNKIIDCRQFVVDFKKQISVDIIETLKSANPNSDIHLPTLAIIKIGNDFASGKYVKNKQKVFEELNMACAVFECEEDIPLDDVLYMIDMLNDFDKVDGIMVQLPLPNSLKDYERVILDRITVNKDVDGLTTMNIGNLQIGHKRNIPCTANGIVKLLKKYLSSIGDFLDGKHCVVVGRSNIVGLPVANLMLKENCTVTVCHSHTKDLQNICKNADILIVAIGKSKFITADYVSEKTIVIDVGINRDENNKITGDVDFDNVIPVCKAITLVPGGIGLTTTTMLAYNTLLNWKNYMKDFIDKGETNE